MAWTDPRARVGESGTSSGGLSDQRLLGMERRLSRLEQATVSRKNVTGDFIASEGETIVMVTPSTGLDAVLPQANTRNRHQRVVLIFTNSNPVVIRAVNGLVNGQPLLKRSRVGSYTAVSDGEYGWWIESLLPPRPRELMIQDWFVSGNTTSGSIGHLGWNLNGSGTPAVSRTSGASLANTRLQITTSNVNTNRSSLTLAATEAGTICRPRAIEVMQTVWRLNNQLTDKRVFFGFQEDFSVAPASSANNLGFLYDSSVGGNYLTIHRFGSTGSATDTGIAMPADTQQLLTIWQPTPTVYELRIGNTVVASMAENTNVAVLPLNIGYRVETLAAATKNIQVGYFGMESALIDGAYDDDPFLQR